MTLPQIQLREESADRLAIRQLIDAYAEYADRHDAIGQMALFTADAHFVVYMDATSTTPSQELHGRDSLAPVLKNLNVCQPTAHCDSQSMIRLNGLRATAETYCIAHQVLEQNDLRSLMMTAIRYIDTFEKVEDAWYFAERKFLVEWIETRKLSWSVPSPSVAFAVTAWQDFAESVGFEQRLAV
jgi:hypothetical protein